MTFDNITMCMIEHNKKGTSLYGLCSYLYLIDVCNFLYLTYNIMLNFIKFIKVFQLNVFDHGFNNFGL